MPWYCRVLSAINTAMPFLALTQKTNLALLVSAILKKRTLCLSELALHRAVGARVGAGEERVARPPGRCGVSGLLRAGALAGDDGDPAKPPRARGARQQ